MYPENLYYTKEHEWLNVDGDEATVGITHHAQDQLGDIVYVELPEEGDDFNEGDEFGSVESVKAVAEVFMPVNAQILETNAKLEDSPELVNQDPHGDGWLIRVKVKDPAQLEELMDHRAYQAFVEEESA